MFRALLLDAITATSPTDYDEQLRMLRTMDQLQVAHLKIIRAVMQPRDPNTDMYMGSPGHVLERRLRDMPRSRINDLVDQLNDLKVLALNVHTTMTAEGAENTAASVTPYGQRLVHYIVQAPPADQGGPDGPTQ